jgi:UDP-hydrolysing UDP-N-acetyl-D-glucosamine 2-epimerase
MRTIGVVTVGRSDYGIYLPLLKAIREDPGLELWLIVSGMHLCPEFGLTVHDIEADGFDVAERVEMSLSSDTPEAIAKSMGLGVIGFAQLYARRRPDILVVLGDRFEMYAAALAAHPFRIPIGHIHGGELTEGAIDDAFRHSMTKLAHLHFVSTDEYSRRVVQLGEEPWRVTVAGALSLDNLAGIPLLDREKLEDRLRMRLDPPPLVVTFHPVTLEHERAKDQIGELLAAIDAAGVPAVFTLPNADTGGRVIIDEIRRYVNESPSAVLVDNLGTRAYFSLMRHAAAMVGNSSSGIIEAPSFKLPVVNIGSRQRGRVRAKNVIDVECEKTEIVDGIKKAVSPPFRDSLDDLVNPYNKGGASEKIVGRLREIAIDQGLLLKAFHDITA